jgi:hypothetical protein
MDLHGHCAIIPHPSSLPYIVHRFLLIHPLSYAPDEDDMVTDPYLAQHLAHWGINMMQVWQQSF